jgi:large subunit ribosomal protein L13
MNSITKIKQSQLEEKWFLIDVEGQRIGTVSAKIAKILQHKNDPMYRGNLKPTYKVVVINSDKLDISPKKSIAKFYKHFSGFPGGLRFISLEDQMVKDSTKVITHAVKGMLPKTKRGDMMMANLYVYKKADHKHTANHPVIVNINNI